jgi:acyl-CoA thioester hydrolase
MRLESTQSPGTRPAVPPDGQESGVAVQAPAYAWPVRVYYEDTDAGGVVYYANYLRFFERCRTEWMRSIGFGQREMAERDGVVFVVAAAEVKYIRPARLDDQLVVDARIAEQFASYVVFEQAVRRDEQVLCRSRMKVACVDARSMRPTRLPAALAAALASDTSRLNPPGAPRPDVGANLAPNTAPA